MSTRQSVVAAAQSLSTGFQTLQTQLSQSRQDVNTQIGAEVTTINSYAQQLATVNGSIQTAEASGNGQPANDLLDQRDQLVASLSKETQVSVVTQGNQYNVFIGNGQPLVLGTTANPLQTVTSPSNSANLEVAYNVNGVTVPIGESSLPGGTLGGLFAFRSTSLDSVQNAIGQVAVGIASTVNAQNELGQNLNGQMGTALFNVGAPVVDANANNTGTGTVSATITNPGAVTTSDYSLKFDGTNYTITRLSDNTVQSTFAPPPTGNQNVVDGVTFNVSADTPAAGDSFLVRPTYGAATGFSVATTDPAQIAAAAPIATSSPTTNTGTGVISAGSVSAGFASASVTPAISLAYTASTNTLSGFPAGASVVATTSAGVSTTYPSGTPVSYTTGMTLSFSGISVGFTGAPADGDTFSIGANAKGTGDSRNAVLLSALQTSNTLNGGTTTFQGAYSQMVNQVGNTTSELTTMGTTETNLLTQAQTSQQSVSGVNLDEETVNLLQYQQAYQASGKLIQIANQLFSTILALNP